ncbi:16S rRNA (cytosine(1402)-N(4))-methyltransferase RsmH [bacterium]|nr:16S rRNA (cytosine(1402)-N(4))-methyltransferase RsmH [bacterium]
MGSVPHRPVLLKEVIDLLQVKPDGVYLDATAGAGGHAEAIAARLTTGRLIAADRDAAAIAIARDRLARFGERAVFAYASFSMLGPVLDDLGVDRLDGVLADLGVSSMQLDDPGRGFSFGADVQVDMRMDTSRGESAARLLARIDEADLSRILRDFGEERYARRVARAIVAERKAHAEMIGEDAGALSAMFTGERLRRIVHGAMPAKSRHAGGIDAATRTFQALRIAVNDELGEADALLDLAIERCRPGARIVVIAFHSLEDRIVKRRFRAWARPAPIPRRAPGPPEPFVPRAREVTRKPVTPGAEEIAANPRSRSARLRAVETAGAPAADGDGK